jgi:hypothetical protein
VALEAGSAEAFEEAEGTEVVAAAGTDVGAAAGSAVAETGAAAPAVVPLFVKSELTLAGG